MPRGAGPGPAQHLDRPADLGRAGLHAVEPEAGARAVRLEAEPVVVHGEHDRVGDVVGQREVDPGGRRVAPHV